MLYHIILSEDVVYHRLFNDEAYKGFYNRVRDEFFEGDFFTKFCRNEAFAEIVPGFMSDCADGMFRHWEKMPEGKKMSVDELAQMAADVILNGVGEEKQSAHLVKSV